MLRPLKFDSAPTPRHLYVSVPCTAVSRTVEVKSFSSSQGSGADDEDRLSRDSGGRQAGSHLPRVGDAPQPAEPHDAER